MTVRTTIFLLILTLFTAAIPAHSTDLPPAPKGYSWARFDETKSAFLKPAGWFVKEGSKGDTRSYFITKEQIDTSGSFKTGLTVTVIPNIPSRKGLPPSTFAAKFIEEIAASREVVKVPWSKDMGPFQSHGVVLKNRDTKDGDFITHNLAIGNDTTGTMYLLIFEAPASSWQSAWKIAEPILQKFLIDSDI